MKKEIKQRCLDAQKAWAWMRRSPDGAVGGRRGAAFSAKQAAEMSDAQRRDEAGKQANGGLRRHGLGGWTDSGKKGNRVSVKRILELCLARCHPRNSLDLGISTHLSATWWWRGRCPDGRISSFPLLSVHPGPSCRSPASNEQGEKERQVLEGTEARCNQRDLYFLHD